MNSNTNFKCKCMYDNIERINLKVDVLMVFTISLMVMMLIPSQFLYNKFYKKNNVGNEEDEEEDDEEEDDEEEDDDDEEDEHDEDEDKNILDETNTENYNEEVIKNKEYDESSEIAESINIGCEKLNCVNVNNKYFCSDSCKNTAILNGYVIQDDISNLELKDEIHKKMFKIKIN